MKKVVFNSLVVAVLTALTTLISCNKDEVSLREFTVTFELGDGVNAISPQKIKEGGKATKPEEIPTRSGYVFFAWYKEADWINEWKFDTDEVTADVTIYAKWIEENNDNEIGNHESDRILKIKATVVNGDSDIDTVKARIYSLIGFPDDGWHWTEFILAAVKYENSGFEMSFPAIVPDDFLWTNVTEGIPLSDFKAKWGRVSIEAYNSDGNHIGNFSLDGEKWSIEYMYSDRNFTEKGTTYFGFEFDCSYKKGWNITYLGYWQRTTQKPLNESFKWNYSAIAFCF